MDRVRHFLDEVKQKGLAEHNFPGLLNVLIGRRLVDRDGTLIAVGVTWREAASLLKKVRWDREAVRQLGLEPSSLPPRDRERYWYAAIVQAHVDSSGATEAGDHLAEELRKVGYQVGPPPGNVPPSPTEPPAKP